MGVTWVRVCVGVCGGGSDDTRHHIAGKMRKSPRRNILKGNMRGETTCTRHNNEVGLNAVADARNAIALWLDARVHANDVQCCVLIA